jgi:hypothetical protein
VRIKASSRKLRTFSILLVDDSVRPICKVYLIFCRSPGVPAARARGDTCPGEGAPQGAAARAGGRLCGQDGAGGGAAGEGRRQDEGACGHPRPLFISLIVSAVVLLCPDVDGRGCLSSTVLNCPIDGPPCIVDSWYRIRTCLVIVGMRDWRTYELFRSYVEKYTCAEVMRGEYEF